MTTQAQRLADLEARQDRMEKRQDEADAMRIDTHNKVSDMHRALMEPQIGQGTKSLIERMAEVTVGLESGGRVARILILIAAALTALAAIMKFGIIKG